MRPSPSPCLYFVYFVYFFSADDTIRSQSEINSKFQFRGKWEGNKTIEAVGVSCRRRRRRRTLTFSGCLALGSE